MFINLSRTRFREYRHAHGSSKKRKREDNCQSNSKTFIMQRQNKINACENHENQTSHDPENSLPQACKDSKHDHINKKTKNSVKHISPSHIGNLPRRPFSDFNGLIASPFFGDKASALCPRNAPQKASFMGYQRRNAQGTTAEIGAGQFSPKAEVTGSTPVGCTNTFNNLDVLLG